MHIRDETILQYIDILQYLLQQYNTIWLNGNISILHIAIYCNVCCLNVVNSQSYITKLTGPLETWIIHLSFLHFYTVIQGVYSFLYCNIPI